MTEAALEAALLARLRALDGAVVAFSGGVDSSLVASLAAEALGDRARAVTAVSPALATGELDGARAVADAVGIAHAVVTTDELARAGYVANGPDRCYHCKTELYDVLSALGPTVLSGANADDLGDWRPGLTAAAEHGVLHPLLEHGVTKAQVRALAARRGVPSADKPASPCLASRLPYGTPVTPATLGQVDRAEQAVRALGFPELRVRHLGALGRIELPAADLERARAQAPALTAAVRAAGYAEARLGDRPLRSGSLNDALPEARARRAAAR